VSIKSHGLRRTFFIYLYKRDKALSIKKPKKTT
jgi:hypothetical protein